MSDKNNQTWVQVCSESDLEEDSGIAFFHNGVQYALFKPLHGDKLYATQNLCPHKQQMVLSRGLLGDSGGKPKISCPLHKRSFLLETGECLNDDAYKIETYPTKVEKGYAYVMI